MAVLAATNPTLLDLARRMDPDGSIADVVELLNQDNEILADMSWQEGNLPTGHRTTVRTGLPPSTWRKMYGGVQPGKSTTAQITDNCGMLEAYAEVDKALADLNGNTAAWRLSEERPQIESINETIASTLFYGNEGTLPESFTGLTPRFNTSLSTGANNYKNVIKAGGASGSPNYGSIWLCCWGPNTGFGIVPKGSTAGLQVRDLGEVTIENIDGNFGRMQAYRTHYRMDAGLTIRDWRYFVRIANIDRTALQSDYTAGGPNLPDLMYQAIERLQSQGMGRCAFYMDRFIRTKLRQQLSYATKGSTLPMEKVGGVLAPLFNEFPLRRVDALAVSETVVP